MNVETSRFGTVEIDAERIIRFPNGLLGFPDEHEFVLLQPNEDALFYWLQSTKRPELAFVVTDPSLFVTGYEVPIRPEQAAALSIQSPEDAQVLTIVNKYNVTLTGNLQGPIVINVTARLGEQLVLADQRWSTRHKLLEPRQPAMALSA